MEVWRWEKRFYDKTIEEAELGVRGYNSLGLYELLKAIAPKTDLGTLAVDPTKLHAQVRRALGAVFSRALPLGRVFFGITDLGIRDLGIRNLGFRKFRDKKFRDKKCRDHKFTD